MPATTSDPRTGRVDRLSQRTRRVVAVATLGGLPAMYVWSSFWLGTSVPTAIWGPISFVLIGFTAVGALVLYRFVRDRADLGATTLDERQRQLRDRAWVVSYGVLSTAVVIVVAILAILVLGLGRDGGPGREPDVRPRDLRRGPDPARADRGPRLAGARSSVGGRVMSRPESGPGRNRVGRDRGHEFSREGRRILAIFASLGIAATLYAGVRAGARLRPRRGRPARPDRRWPGDRDPRRLAVPVSVPGQSRPGSRRPARRAPGPGPRPGLPGQLPDLRRARRGRPAPARDPAADRRTSGRAVVRGRAPVPPRGHPLRVPHPVGRRGLDGAGARPGAAVGATR